MRQSAQKSALFNKAPPIPDPELAPIAAETEAAWDAIAALQLQSKSTSFYADNARNSLDQLAAAAAPTRPDPDASSLDPVLDQIAVATGAAKAAIDLLQKLAARPGFDGEMARASLTLLIAEAAPPVPAA